MTDDQAQPAPERDEHTEAVIQDLKARGMCGEVFVDVWGDESICVLEAPCERHGPPTEREEREERVRTEIDRWVALVMGDSSKAGEAAQGLHDLFRRTHSPEEPVGEEEAVALAKSYGYVVIHRSAWEFMRDDPHPERCDWNSPLDSGEGER